MPVAENDVVVTIGAFFAVLKEMDCKFAPLRDNNE
jgi:hypothetical protein